MLLPSGNINPDAENVLQSLITRDLKKLLGNLYGGRRTSRTTHGDGGRQDLEHHPWFAEVGPIASERHGCSTAGRLLRKDMDAPPGRLTAQEGYEISPRPTSCSRRTWIRPADRPVHSLDPRLNRRQVHYGNPISVAETLGCVISITTAAHFLRGEVTVEFLVPARFRDCHELYDHCGSDILEIRGSTTLPTVEE
ncbi:Pkinase-domain-containing protein [Apiospora saccharicola]|uniref:Pkinase-domain-containing protein n=1 Tax=Apiospora saccharicola TaxID=335842 RepID=A0ABR1W3F3_9PEZI